MPMSTLKSTSSPKLFSSLSLGEMDLANRIVMAPLTRVRAGAKGVPGDLMVEYYRQRSGVGLIVTEGTYPSLESQGWVGAPGIATEEQGAGWRRVFDGVHVEGGRIFMQIMHAGRAGHPEVNGGRRVLAPSAVGISGTVFTERGLLPFPVPEAMTPEDARRVVEDFVAAALRAIDVGADGVEIHGANGYLLHQFLSPAANQRDDEYGGSPEKRIRFVIDVVMAVADAIGPGRVGLRISPENNSVGDVFETDPQDVLTTYGALADNLRPLGLAYLSVLHRNPTGDLAAELRQRFSGIFLINSGFEGGQTTREQALRQIEDGHADAIVVGRALIANPDLVERWLAGHPENEPRPELFYASAAEGYTDYPRFALN